MRRLLAIVAAILTGLFAPAPGPFSLPSLRLLLVALTVVAATGWTGCLSLGLPGDAPPVEGGAP